MKQQIRAFKALADESRLRVLNLLLDGECCACEVMQALDVSQSKASRDLGALRDAGFLKTRREGLWCIYSLDHDGMGEDMAALVGVVRRSLAGNAEAMADRERRRTATRMGVRELCAQRRKRRGA